MKTIGVICLDNDDFNQYMDYYLKNINIIGKAKNLRKTNNESYIAIYSEICFTGVTFYEYIFTRNANKNNNINNIIKLITIHSYHKYV
jgi:hypothetical protein